MDFTNDLDENKFIGSFGNQESKFKREYVERGWREHNSFKKFDTQRSKETVQWLDGNMDTMETILKKEYIMWISLQFCTKSFILEAFQFFKFLDSMQFIVLYLF